MYLNAAAYLSKFERLLKLESDAETEQYQRQLQSGGQGRGGLSGLAIRDSEAALGGRVLVTLSRRADQEPLPFNRLTVGSPIMLAEEGVKSAVPQRGIVCYRDKMQIQVAVSELPEEMNARPLFRLDLSSDEVSRQRILSAMRSAMALARGRVTKLRSILLGENPPEFAAESSAAKPLLPWPAHLNTSQKQAVEQALSARDFALIHGPPGTGKTTTVAELCRQIVARDEKILACAASNLAVDNLLEKLLDAGVEAIRLGHPARISPRMREHSLDLLAAEHPDLKIARKLVREAEALQNKASKYTRAKPEPGARKEMRSEARALIADARHLEDQIVKSILDSADVICATLTGLDPNILDDRTFGTLIIDEAGQAIEPACWPALLRGERVILAGDHCQLPPTVLSVEAAREGLATSLLERLATGEKAFPSSLLTTQYRMHPTIMQFSSQQFYGGKLEAYADAEKHTLAELARVTADDATQATLLFIDTAGAGYDEEPGSEGESLCSPQEAELIVKQVEQLLESGVLPAQIGVISPYAAQVRLLRDKLASTEVGVDTIDGFQGQEREAILISLVRSNGNGEVGFLSDTRRMNVALTRARRKLVVVGDTATLCQHPFYAKLVEYLELCGAYKSVWELG
ncbi:MAG: AAA domain-containing protein [Planctomycetaceae bacterium]